MVTREERHKFFLGKRIYTESKQEQVLLQTVLFASGFKWDKVGTTFKVGAAATYFIGIDSENSITHYNGEYSSELCSIYNVEVFKHLTLTKEELVSVLNNHRILVSNEEESRQLQEFLFTLGCGWGNQGSIDFNEIRNLKHPIIVLYNRSIKFSDDHYDYNIKFVHLKKLMELFSRPENPINIVAKQSAIEYFKGKAIYVTSPEQSKILQESLFKLGWEWALRKQKVSYTEYHIIIVHDTMRLTCVNQSSKHKTSFEDIPKEYLIQEEMKEESKFPELKPGMVVELTNGDIGFVLLKDNEQSCYIASANCCLSNDKETHTCIARVGIFNKMLPRRVDSSYVLQSKAIDWVWEKPKSKDSDKVTIQAPAPKEPAKVEFKEQTIIQTTFKKFF